MPTPFKEDFFERVIDVKWDTEPEVFWLVGSGAPGYVNGMGSIQCCVYRSADGKHWYGTLLGQRVDSYRSFGAFFGGCWMRKGMQEGAPPVWMLCGGSSRTVATACSGHSTDGETFGDRVVFDERHICEDVIPGTAGITMYQMSTMETPFVHFDPFRSSDCRNWTPANYHGGENIIGGLAVQAAPEAVQTTTRAAGPARRSKIISVTGDPLEPQSTQLARASTFAGINPLAPGDTQTVADKILFKGTEIYAVGKVRKGPHRGKRLTIIISPYHNPPDGGSHGDDTVQVYVQEKNGSNTFAGTFNTRMSRSMSIGYGHYTFVVTGGDSRQRSKISWSEDGVRWRPVDLGPYGQINGIAVGPRPSNAQPKPPRADEITNDGNTVGTGKPPVFP